MHRRTVVLFVSFAALLLAAATAGAAGKAHQGFVYTLTNSPGGNAVAVFARADDGTLATAGTVATGGLGTGANLGSQGSIIVSGHKLFAVNAGDNSISYFRIRHAGLELQDTIASGGVRPISLTVHGDVLYVLNAGGSGNITGFTVRHDEFAPLAGSTQPLGAGSAGPAQVSFAPKVRPSRFATWVCRPPPGWAGSDVLSISPTLVLPEHGLRWQVDPWRSHERCASMTAKGVRPRMKSPWLGRRVL